MKNPFNRQKQKPAAPPRAFDQRVIWLSTLVLLLAAFGRYWHLTRLDFWVDEAWTVWFSVLDAYPWDTLGRLMADVHPPLYFLTVNAWIGVAGISEQALKMLSVWPSLIAVAAVIRLGRDWFGRWGGVLAGLVLAVSMYHIWYAQEVRHYPALTMFAAVAVLLYTRWLRRKPGSRPRRWLAIRWVVWNALMLWTHYLGVLVIGVQALHFLLTQGRKHWRAGLLMLAGVGLLFAPWLPVFRAQITGNASHNTTGLGQAIPTTPQNIWLQFTYMSSSQPLLYGLILACAAWGTWQVMRKRADFGHDGVLLAWLWAFIPLILLLVVNPFFSIYNVRNALLIMPGFALLTGFGLVWLVRSGAQARARTREATALQQWAAPAFHQAPLPGLRLVALRLVPWLAGMIIAGVLVLSPLQTQHHRPAITDEKPVRDIYEAVAAHYQPGDAIFIDPACGGCYNPHEWEYYERVLIGETVPIFRWNTTPEGERIDGLTVTADWPREPRVLPRAILPPRLWYISDLRGRDEATLEFLLHGEGEQRGIDGRREIASGGIFELTGQLLVRAPGPAFGFGEAQAIQLRGVQMPQSATPGETITVRLWWRTLAPLDQDYSVSVQLVGPDGTLITQHDGPPTELFQGEAYPWPTSGWQPGDYILDDHPLDLPPDLPAGDYRVQVVFYQWWDDIRWPAFDEEHAPLGDAAGVGRLHIEGSTP